MVLREVRHASLLCLRALQNFFGDDLKPPVDEPAQRGAAVTAFHRNLGSQLGNHTWVWEESEGESDDDDDDDDVEEEEEEEEVRDSS